MDETFLQNYANNVAQAQEPVGVAAVQSQPGFENYQPSFVNQDLTPMGITPGPDTRQLPDFREMAKNVAINTGKRYAMKKLGIDGLAANVLGTMTNPIGALYTVGSLLPSGVKGIAEVLRSKRAQKAAEREARKNSINTLQQKIDAGTYGSASNQDRGRGQTSSSSSSTSDGSKGSRGSGMSGFGGGADLA
jgi:hypothetical protein